MVIVIIAVVQRDACCAVAVVSVEILVLAQENLTLYAVDRNRHTCCFAPTCRLLNDRIIDRHDALHDLHLTQRLNLLGDFKLSQRDKSGDLVNNRSVIALKVLLNGSY